MAQIGELIRYEINTAKAIEGKKWSEAKYLLRSILNKATDSCKHTCQLLEVMVLDNPSDLTDPISFTTKVQNQFIEQPDFLFWRGRVLIYNG